MSDTRPKRQRTWRGWLLRTGLTFLALLTLGVVVAWIGLRTEAAGGKTELATALADLDASVPRWRWDELEADAAPPGDAARVVREFAAALGKWKPPPSTNPDGKPVNRRLDDEALALVRDELAGREPAVALARTLKDHPSGRTTVRISDDYFSTALPHVEPTRHAATLLQLDVERLLHEGATADAPDRVRAILRAGSSLRDEPFLLCVLARFAIRHQAVRAAERVLGMGTLPDDACRRLIADFEAERAEDPLLVGLRGERAGYHRLFENLDAGRVSLPAFFDSAVEMKSGFWQRLLFLPYTYRLPEDHAFYLRRITAACDVARLPPERQTEAWQEFEAEIRGSKMAAAKEYRRILAHLLLPAVSKVGERALRDRADLACAVAALLAERHRLADGRWPEELPGAPPDPFTGGPLRLSRHADGVAISSAGPVGKEVGVRLYDVSRRGLPAEGE